MAKNGRRGKRKAGNPKRPLRHSPHNRRRGPGDLMDDTRRELATGDPLDFLAYVSALVAALDPRSKNPFERAPQQVTVPELVGSFAAAALPETTALLAAMGLLDQPDDAFPVEELMLDALAEDVGGYDALDSLDDIPLPDEEFAWASVPEDARDLVQQVLDKCDQGADGLLGPEYRTACRRLLAQAARGIPGTSLASARPELVAAGVCWVIGRGNHRFGTRPGELKVKDLTGYFGVAGSTVSQRGNQVIEAAGLQHADDAQAIRPAPPSLLVSERRRQIINQRDRYRAGQP